MNGRKALLAKVHLGAAQLNMDEETRRALLERVTGHRSAAEASDTQLEAVLAEYRRSGWRARRAADPSDDTPVPTPTQAGKIRALWGELHRRGAVRDTSDKALRTWCRRQGLGDAPELLGTYRANKAIEALKRWLVRLPV